eukprot:11345154-Alexandrium_andersonii.AAC.1
MAGTAASTDPRGETSVSSARNRERSATRRLQLWALGAQREVRRHWGAAPKPRGRRLPPIPSARRRA